MDSHCVQGTGRPANAAALTTMSGLQLPRGASNPHEDSEDEAEKWCELSPSQRGDEDQELSGEEDDIPMAQLFACTAPRATRQTLPTEHSLFLTPAARSVQN